jgi:hypothetical protein
MKYFIPNNHWFVTGGEGPAHQKPLVEVKRYAITQTNLAVMELAKSIRQTALDENCVYEILGPGGSVWVDHESDIPTIAKAITEMMSAYSHR